MTQKCTTYEIEPGVFAKGITPLFLLNPEIDASTSYSINLKKYKILVNTLNKIFLNEW
jgi:hypothetical protein